MDNFELDKQAKLLADTESAYSLARRFLVSEQEREKLTAHVGRSINSSLTGGAGPMMREATDATEEEFWGAVEKCLDR